MTTQTTKAEALKELADIENEANVMGKGFGHWVRDKIIYATELVKLLREAEGE